MGRNITDFLLYRWRYILGYGVILLVVVSLMVIAGLYIPGALSQAEINSVVTSSQPLRAFDPAQIINLPYHLLQRASISLFGVTIFSVKLPSLILGGLSIVGMLLLLRGWFHRNVAVLTTLLIITTGQFLFTAQNGTPGIVYIFWSVWLLVAALMISRRTALGWLWKIVLAVIIALSLYTPLSIYIIVALLSAIALHPHLRYLVRRLSIPKTALACLVGLVLIAPLIYTIWQHPEVGLTLLGWPSGPIDIQANILRILKQYFDFVAPASGTFMTPIYGFGSIALIVLGIMRLVTTKYTARSYIITAWSLLLIPVLIINPSFVSITFVPALLLMAMGVASLLHMWYSLFPRNPYARIVGLVPLIILMGGMLLSGVDRYMYGYSYDPRIAGFFSKDLRLINRQIKQANGAPLTLVTSKEEQPFYTVVAKHAKQLTVTTDWPSKQPFIATRAVYHAEKRPQPSRIVTDPSSANADRFYIYKNNQK